MAFLDTTHLDRKPTAPIALEALMAQLDLKRLDFVRQRLAEPKAPGQLHSVQQMLLAAAGAAGVIVAVAAAMLFSLL